MKKHIETIDVTPTWKDVTPILMEASANGTGEGRSIAKKELVRMVGIADKTVKYEKVLKQNIPAEEKLAKLKDIMHGNDQGVSEKQS